MAVTRHLMTAKAGLDARDRAQPQMRHMKSMVRTMMMMGLTVKSSEKWMRNRSRAGGRRNRDRRRDSSDGSRDRDGDGSRTNAGPAPEWDGDGLSFQDYAIKARLWLATTRSKPRTRGPLLLQRLAKVPFETMKFLAKDRKWMASETKW